MEDDEIIPFGESNAAYEKRTSFLGSIGQWVSILGGCLIALLLPAAIPVGIGLACSRLNGEPEFHQRDSIGVVNFSIERPEDGASLVFNSDGTFNLGREKQAGRWRTTNDYRLFLTYKGRQEEEFEVWESSSSPTVVVGRKPLEEQPLAKCFIGHYPPEVEDEGEPFYR